MREKSKSSKSSLRERLERKRKEISERGKGLRFLVLKEGTIRVRVLPVGEEEEFGIEVTQFYLGSQIKGVISPSTLGLPCPILDKYNELKDSKNPSDKALAKKLSPKKRVMVPVIAFTDKTGKSVDTEKSTENGKLFMITSSIYASMLDHYLDDGDWGDFTDIDDGYDFKITRTGTTQFDTEYSLSPCPKTPTPKPYRSLVVDLNKMVADILPTYEEAEEKLAEYLNESSPEEEEEEERPRRPKRKGTKRNSDDDL